MNDSTANVIDLNELRPEPKYVRLGDVTFDVSCIPLGVTMKGVSLQAKFTDADAAETIDALVEWMAEVIKLSAPEVTKEWLLATIVSQEQLLRLTNLIMEGAMGQDTTQGEVPEAEEVG